MTDYSEESLAALIAGARDSVVRVEGHDRYAVGGREGERLAAWRAGRPRPERSIRTDGYLRLVADVTGREVAWERLRLLTPGDLSEYEEFQLIGYQESQVAGEHVLIAPRPADWATPDFWMVDWETVVELRYDADGAPAGMRRSDDLATANRAIGVAEWVRRQSVTLAEFVAPSPRRAVG